MSRRRSASNHLMPMNNKALERHYIRLLQKAVPALPQGDLNDCESPDFIMDTTAGRIGLEVTRLFKAPDLHGRRLQVQENECALMVKEATRLYEATGSPPVEVHVHMAGQTEFNKKNRGQFAQALAKLVSSRVPSDRSWIEISNKFDNPDLFPFEIDCISIARYGHERNYWSVPDGGWVQEDFASELQLLIDQKNSLLPNYSNLCTAHWLVIVIEGTSGSTLFEPSQETLNHAYSSDFERAFLLDRLLVKAYELRRLDAS